MTKLSKTKTILPLALLLGSAFIANQGVQAATGNGKCYALAFSSG